MFIKFSITGNKSTQVTICLSLKLKQNTRELVNLISIFISIFFTKLIYYHTLSG